MSAPGLVGMSASALAGMVRRGEVTAVEVAGAHLARIDALEPDVRAFLWRDESETLRQAAAVDRARAAGRDPGPLAGVPVAVK
ncbi:MAG: amidase family protein, partial [Acidimicrobiia bacterium]